MLLILVLVAVGVCGVVVPFTWGLVRGPRQPSFLAPLPALAVPALAVPGHARKALLAPMRPLGRVAGIYGRFLVLYVVIAAWHVKDGFYGGLGVCVDTGIGGYRHAGAAGSWQAARPGTSLSTAGDLQACVLHPTTAQWGLLLLTKLPGLLLWGCVLLAILRLVRHAARYGAFTPRAAAMMRQLGWLVIVGSAVVGALGALGTDVLADMVMTPQPFDSGYIATSLLVAGPLRVLLPVPALAGAALLAFGSMTRAGAVMDEELKATV